jgi:hypothetical protein
MKKHLYTRFHLSLSLSLSTAAWLLATGVLAQSFPPDPFGDADNFSWWVMPNAGQVLNDTGGAEPDIAYYAQGGPSTFFHADGRISFVQVSPDTAAGVDTLRRVDLTLAGSKAQYPDPVAMVPRGHHANFYLPQCGPSGAAGVQPYGRLRYPAIYPKIHLHVYSGANGQKLAFEVKPGGNVADMELHFQGQDTMLTDGSGNLLVMVDGQAFMLPAPYSYQTDSLTILPVGWTASYQVNAGTGTVTFSVGAYDASKPLVILLGPAAMPPSTFETPGLCWSTYYGAEMWDFPKDIKADSDGNVFVAGRTTSLFSNFPHESGATPTGVGASMVTLTKFNAAHELIWTNFHGGTSNNNSNSTAAAVAIKESTGRVYVGGQTDASDFFTWNLPGAYNDGNNNNPTPKGFVASYDELNGDLIWASYIGNSNTSVQAVDVIPYSGQVAISGITRDNLPLGNFLPPSNGYTFSTFHTGVTDAFLALLTPGDAIEWSAYYGGSGNETMGLVRWQGKSLVLAGITNSIDLPVFGPPLAFQEAYHGSGDLFLAEIDKDNGAFTWATYFGGPGNDWLAPQGISRPRDLFLTGTCNALSTLVNGTGWYDNASGPGRNGFIARFAVDSHQPKWITYLGNGPNQRHSPYCIDAAPYTVNSGSPVIVGGYTDDTGFPILNATGWYNQPNIIGDDAGTKDGFLIRFNDQQDLIWSSYFGGHADGLQQPENVTALASVGPAIYAVGYVTQTNGFEPNHIPLAGIVGDPMFFNWRYNYNGAQGLYSDGFITEFCSEVLPMQGMQTGLEGSSTTGLIPWSISTDGDLTLQGLPEGLHCIQVYDAQGRFVLERNVYSAAGISDAIHLREWSAAVYLVVVDHERTFRLVPIR